jgi:hypothetical protein
VRIRINSKTVNQSWSDKWLSARVKMQLLVSAHFLCIFVGQLKKMKKRAALIGTEH